MRKLLIGVAMGLGIGTAALASDPVEGIWKTAEGEEGGYLFVQIKQCGSAICGTINTAFDKDGARDNAHEHLGKKMIWDMAPKGDGYYAGGKIWAPDSDKTYSSKMQLNGNTLTVKGCVAGGLFCRGQDWSRVK